MGLLDVLNGMANGPRGAKQPSQPSGGGGGMSPWIIALLGVLAYKAMKGKSGSDEVTARQPIPRGGTTTPVNFPADAGNPGGGALGDLLGGLFGGKPAGGQPGRSAGGLADMIPGGLGGLLGGAAAGSVLSGGLGNLIRDLQSTGHGREAQSWVGTGANEDIAPGDLEQALGGDTIEALSRQTGMGRDELIAGLSQQLPELVDQLTPDGRLPTEEEVRRMV
jgi:uncharacterized protein YidB (DUF937 family)